MLLIAQFADIKGLPKAQSYSVVHIGRFIDMGGELFNLNLKLVLDVVQNILLIISRDEGNCESLGSESSGSSYSVHVLVDLVRHVVVEDDVDLFDINSSSEDIG